jgi:hypothetical protein
VREPVGLSPGPAGVAACTGRSATGSVCHDHHFRCARSVLASLAEPLTEIEGGMYSFIKLDGRAGRGRGPTNESSKLVCFDAWAGRGLVSAQQRYGTKRSRSLATAVYACRPIGRGVNSARRWGGQGKVRASRKVLVRQIARWVGLVVPESAGRTLLSARRARPGQGAPRNMIRAAFADYEASEGSIS